MLDGFLHFRSKDINSHYPDWFYDPKENEILIDNYVNGSEKFLGRDGDWDLYFITDDKKIYRLDGYNRLYSDVISNCVRSRLKYLCIDFKEIKDDDSALCFRLKNEADAAVFTVHFFDIIKLTKNKNKYKYDKRKRAKKRNRR